jgi:hypothetical protein
MKRAVKATVSSGAKSHLPDARMRRLILPIAVSSLSSVQAEKSSFPCIRGVHIADIATLLQ